MLTTSKKQKLLADPYNIAGIIYFSTVPSLVKKPIKQKSNEKSEGEIIHNTVQKIVNKKMDPLLIKYFKAAKAKGDKRKVETLSSIAENTANL